MRLLRAICDRAFRRALPYIFQRLDNEMPSLLRTTPAIMTAEIGAAIAQATGQPATARQIEHVARLYDPLQAVLRNIR